MFPAPDKSFVVTAGGGRRVIVAGATSVSLPSYVSSADTTYHVPEDVVNQFVSPKRFALRIGVDTSARFFPLWFRQSIETGQDATQEIASVEHFSEADSDSNQSSRQVVLYRPPDTDYIRACAVIVEVRESDNDGSVQESSKKAGKRRQRSRSKSRKSSQKSSGSGKPAPKAPGNQDHITRGSSSTSTFNREDSVPRGGYFYRAMSAAHRILLVLHRAPLIPRPHLRVPTLNHRHHRVNLLLIRPLLLPPRRVPLAKRRLLGNAMRIAPRI